MQRHPQLVVEVLSDGTAAFDRGQKFEAYRSLGSLTAYLLLDQDRPHADLFLRNAAGLWVLNPIGADETIPLAAWADGLPIADVYEGVDFGSERPLGGIG